MFPLLFRDRRKVEELAVNIAAEYPSLDQAWVRAIVRRAYDVSSRSTWSALDMMRRLHLKTFPFPGFKAPLVALLDPEIAIPEEWA
jgi:hypothetical protein